MALESVIHISDLVATNLVGATDPKSEGDDHLRNIKTALLTDFPNINGAVTASLADLNATTNFEETISATTSEVTIPTAKTFNITDVSGFKIGGVAVTATAAEVNYLDITTLGTGAASKAVVLDAGDDYTWPATGVFTYAVLNDGTTSLTATIAEINTVADGITATAAEINTVCDGVLTGSATYDPINLVDGAVDSTTITVTGAAIGDFVIVAPGVEMQTITYSAAVSAADTVEVTLVNDTGGTINLLSSTWKVKVLK